jgi:hypothetical protein
MKNKLLILSVVALAINHVMALEPSSEPNSQPSNQIIINNYMVAPQTQAPQPQAPAPQAPVDDSPKPWTFVLYVWKQFSDHNISAMTSLCQDGLTNYFGHRFTSLGAIATNMNQDRQRYGDWKVTYYPATFWHEVSQEYSRYWTGPMMYDHIDMDSDVYEYGVRWHHAHVRFIVGYTNVGGTVQIYSLTYQVLN